MNVIAYKDFNLGGISDSLLQGGANSMAEIVGCDIHSEPGFVKVNQRLTKESGVTVDDLVKVILPCSDGNAYLFGSTNGKIWKRTSAGTYSLEATAAPAAGAVGILDAWEYQGYIYYAMQSRLGRVAVGAPTDWATRSDSWATFTNTDASFHPMKEVNQVLYIGDKHYVAQVDSGVFSANALDIKTPLRVKSLGKMLTDLLLGTYISSTKALTEILRWNTWSESYSVADEVPEIGINSFLATDNFVLVSAGTKGNLYLYNGASLDIFKRIPGDWTGANEAVIHPNASVNRFGMALFGLSNLSGNPAKQGMYSLGSYDRNYPMVLNLENLISTGNSTGIDIGAIQLIGTTVLVSWKDTTGGTTYGVDKIDTTLKVAAAYISTRLINLARTEKKTFSATVPYRLLPDGTSIKIYYKDNYAASWTELTTTTDTLNKTVDGSVSIPQCNVLLVKVELNSSVNTAPEIEGLELSFS